jgi:hypothetical protein
MGRPPEDKDSVSTAGSGRLLAKPLGYVVAVQGPDALLSLVRFDGRGARCDCNGFRLTKTCEHITAAVEAGGQS